VSCSACYIFTSFSFCFNVLSFYNCKVGTIHTSSQRIDSPDRRSNRICEALESWHNRFLSRQYRTVKHSSYLANSFDQITLGTDRSLASQRTSQREVTSHRDRVKGNFHRGDGDQKSKRKRKRKPCDVSPCPSPRRMSADTRFLHRIA